MRRMLGHREYPLCRCGCGERVWTRHALYIRGHSHRGSVRRDFGGVPETKRCVNCEAEFRPLSNNKGKIFCKSRCYGAYLRKQSGRVPGERTCKGCSTAFMSTPRHPNKLFCTVQCHGVWKRKYPELPKCRRCGNECGKRNSQGYRRADRKFCSRECYEQYRREHTGSNRSARNAEKMKNAYLLVRPQVCQICGYDRYVEWAHLIPKREGGTAASVNIAILCPNHHKLFDRGLLSEAETAILAPLLEEAKRDRRARLPNHRNSPDCMKVAVMEPLPLFNTTFAKAG